jgi:toxin CcdB
MARFDVYELTGNRGWVVDCQSDLLSHFNSRFVVPLLPASKAGPSIPRLTPTFQIDGKTMVMATHLAVSIPVKVIMRTVSSLKPESDQVIGAIDALISDA